ncbi:UNKNOWN [Stylonychia lemnae]|uniref:Uncharacterized protein n=1 Tax=Stylonychia lemnae TaxID=5949 RepID=A0A078AV88_STYLE|nr:UNKNOWN [Stylonychia lemnae]|eukprot:CDW86114.1 UNKNOWN [Stylonychia lemnae]
MEDLKKEGLMVPPMSQTQGKFHRSATIKITPQITTHNTNPLEMSGKKNDGAPNQLIKPMTSQSSFKLAKRAGSKNAKRDLNLQTPDQNKHKELAFIGDTEKFLLFAPNIQFAEGENYESQQVLIKYIQILQKASQGEESNLSSDLDLFGQDFQEQERFIFDHSRAQVDYISQLRLKSQKLLDILKTYFQRTPISSDNNVQKFNFRDQIEGMSREELLKNGRQKEIELEDIRQRLILLRKNAKRSEQENDENFEIEIPQTSIDVDYASKINEQQQEFNKTYRLLSGYQNQIFERLRSPQHFVDPQETEMLLTQYQNQFDKVKQIQDTIFDENTTLYDQKIDLASRLDTMTKNNRYLENRLASTLTEKEETIIKLKSEIVIYKSKLQNYKNKLKEAFKGYETKRITDLTQKQLEQLDEKNITIQRLQNELDEVKSTNQQLQAENQSLQFTLQQNQDNFVLQAEEEQIRNLVELFGNDRFQLSFENDKDLPSIISKLSKRLKEIDQEYSYKLSKVDNVRDLTQKKLNIEEKERTFMNMKLEYMISNYRKMHMQKRFLEKSLEKDMKNLAQEMRKAETEIQRDIYIASNSAQTRINSMYSIIKESLRYVKEIISFMNFDVDRLNDEEYLNNVDFTADQKGEIEIQLSSKEDPLTRLEKSRLNSEKQLIEDDQQDQKQIELDKNVKGMNQKVIKEMKSGTVSLETCYYKHIYELSEVLLTILSEIYKESRTQTSVESLQLFDLLQQKTNKKIVSEIYNKFFAQNRIHFAQYLNKIGEKNFDLQQERIELKQQVHRLSSQLQELMDEQEKEQEEELKQQQEQLHFQEMVEEELKEQDLGDQTVTNGNRGSLEMLKNQQNIMFHRNQTVGNSALNSNREDLGNTNSMSDINKDQSATRQPFNIKDLFLNLQQTSTLGKNNQSSAAVASVLLKSQEKKVIDMMAAENSALKERVRETRLLLQRQITELQDQLKAQKEQHYGEKNTIKLEYSKDLSILHKMQKERELQIREEFVKEQEMLKQELMINFDLEKKDLIDDYDGKNRQIQIESELCNRKKEELEKELRKLKKLSNKVSQGGWGTFSIVFEEYAIKETSQNQGTSTPQMVPNSPQKSPIDIFKDPTKPKTLTKPLNVEDSLSDSTQKENQEQTFNNTREIKLPQLNHFIEVGFLMDQKSFTFVDDYQERTHRSMLKKHLFEFQDPIDNHKMIQLQNKIKQQLVENFALFNEINPIYITLNLGRTISPFWDDSLSQDHFKLIKREGHKLNGQTIIVNFLKCDEPHLVIRVIAFDHEKCQQHSFDLLFEDLMMIIDGNMKLLEEDHLQDLCQIILNNLTMIKRSNQKNKRLRDNSNDEDDDEDGTTLSTNGKASRIQSLLERRQGRETSIVTNPTVDYYLAVEHKLFFKEQYRAVFDQSNKSILSKHDKRKKGLVQEKQVGTDFEKMIIYEAFESIYEEQIGIMMGKDQTQTMYVILLRGKQSQHLQLRVKINDTFIDQYLMLFQTELSKDRQTQQMTSEIIRLPQQLVQDTLIEGFIFALERIYGLDSIVIKIVAISKYDNQRMENFQWNPNQQHQFGSLIFTEQLIYLQKISNNKYIKLNEYEILSTEIRTLLFMYSYGYESYLKDFGRLSAIQNLNIKTPIEKQSFATMKLIFRDFGIVRIKHVGQKKIDDYDEEVNDQDYFENVFALYSFYDDLSCLTNKEIHIHLKLQTNYEELHRKISIKDILNDQQIISLKSNPEKYMKMIINKLIIIQDSKQEKEIIVDPEIQSVQEVIDEIKRQKYLAQLDQVDLMDTEIDQKSLQISLNQLAECNKQTTVSIINRKVFKVTSYFVINLKNLKIQQQPKKAFDWQLIYIDAYQRQTAKSFIIIITEKDIQEIFNRLKNVLNKNGEQQRLLEIYNENEIFSGKVKKDMILDLVLDTIVLNEIKGQLQISITHLISRLEDRLRLRQDFKLCGSKFITKMGAIEDPDHLVYKTSLPQIEVTRKVILNIEKEFSDKKYDIKIYELTLKNLKDEKKYQFEMFCIEEPNALFRSEYYSQAQLKGKKLLIERFNIIQQMHHDYEENKFIRDGMVLAVVEQSFPHQIIFMILEPASHIQWQFVIKDNKLNQIEDRVDKEYFVDLAQTNINQGVIGQFKSSDEILLIQNLGYQKDYHVAQVDVWQGNLKSAFNDSQLLIYARSVQILVPGTQNEYIFAECQIYSQRIFNSLQVRVTYDEKYDEASFIYETQRESSRILSGFLCIAGTKIKLVYSIETSQAYTQQEKAIRVIVKEPQLNQSIIDIILAEKHLLNIKQTVDNKQLVNVKDEIKFAFNTGFKDSYALFQKLPDLVNDFKKAFIQPIQRFQYNQQVDTSRLMYRKLVNYLDSTLIIFIKYESIELAEQEWIVVLYDKETALEEQFKFQLEHILTKDELNSLNVKNDRIMKDIVSRVVDKRLKIKIIDDQFQIVKLLDSNNNSKGVLKKRYFAYFIDPPLGVAADVKNIIPHNFDIRNMFRFSLTNPDYVIPDIVEPGTQERVIIELMKDDLQFDVSEVLNPYELILRIKTYYRETLSMISSCDIREFDIRKELIRDQVSFLMEPLKRVDLAKYIIENIYFDEGRKRVFFMKTHIQAEQQ